jgi:hypothetical protein
MVSDITEEIDDITALQMIGIDEELAAIYREQMEGLDHDDEFGVWLKNTEILAHYEGHRATIIGIQFPGESDNNGYAILDGRYSKEVKEDGTIIITDHSEYDKVYVCNKETGLRFIEAPNGEVYEPDCYYHTDKIPEV